MSIKFIITERIINEICTILSQEDSRRGILDEKGVVSVFMGSMRGHDWNRSRTLEDGSSLSRMNTGDLSPTVTIVEKDIAEFGRFAADWFRENKIDNDTPHVMKDIFTRLFRFSADDRVFEKSQFRGLKTPISSEGSSEFPVLVFVSRNALADAIFEIMEAGKHFRPLSKDYCLRLIAESFNAENKEWISVLNSGHVQSGLEDKSEIVRFWSDGIEEAMGYLASIMITETSIVITGTYRTMSLGSVCRRLIEFIGESSINEDDLYLAKLRRDAQRAADKGVRSETDSVTSEPNPSALKGTLVQMTDKDLSRIVDRLADTVRARPETSKSSLLNIVAAEVAGPGHDWGLIKRGWPKNAQT